jgi:hypothetical protein
LRWRARCGKTRRASIAQEERDKLDDISREEMRAVELARIKFEENVRHKYQDMMQQEQEHRKQLEAGCAKRGTETSDRIELERSVPSVALRLDPRRLKRSKVSKVSKRSEREVAAQPQERLEVSTGCVCAGGCPVPVSGARCAGVRRAGGLVDESSPACFMKDC